MKKIIRLELRFIGRVQGVGFRWQMLRAAGESLTGWVRNESDGSVLAEVQGSQQDIDQMIQRLSSGPFIRISEIHQQEIALAADEKTFRVDHQQGLY